jgi:hypothetical protein
MDKAKIKYEARVSDKASKFNKDFDSMFEKFRAMRHHEEPPNEWEKLR